MCFLKRKSKRKMLQDLEKKIDELSFYIKTKEHEKLLKDSEELKHNQDLLKKVCFNLKESHIVQTEDGEKIKFIFERPVVVIGTDEEGELEKNDFFYAINYLGLTKLEDIKKMQKNIDYYLKERRNKQ